MSQTRKLYTHQRFAFMTLDPVHIGTGGYRLGRVDNTIEDSEKPLLIDNYKYYH